MSLQRFIDAQRSVYPRAVAELRSGEKLSHWMWFIFPQIAGLGHSEAARRYAIADPQEARDFLDHPLLGNRLRECADTMIGWAGRKSAEEILGTVDAMKFCSSMTLFEAASGSGRFGRAIDLFCDAERDGRTLHILMALEAG